MLEHVSVMALAADGKAIPIGETDVFGSLSVPREELGRDKLVTVLFCKDWYFCGALRLETGALAATPDHHLQLAPLAFR